jgi:undecaprenyl-diphosphatase
MVTLLEILILAIIQGVTEWLPISSSGHLVIVQEYMGLSLPVLFDVVLHLGSLVVVLFVFWRDVLRVLKAVARFDFKSLDGKLGVYVVVGSVATAAIGLVFRDVFESFFHNLNVVGLAFVVTGCFYSLLFVFRRGNGQSRPLNVGSAIAIGVAQGVALIPGVSRSGSTITTGLLLEVEKEVALRFSFLLFIPAVIGATVLSVIESDGLLVAVVDPVSLLVGLVVTVLVGYLSLRLLLRIVMKSRLYLFAFYCWAVGSAVLLAQFLGL